MVTESDAHRAPTLHACTLVSGLRLSSPAHSTRTAHVGSLHTGLTAVRTYK